MTIWQTRQWWDMLVESGQAEAVYEVDNIFVEKRRIALGQFWLFALWVNSSKIPYKKLQSLCKEKKCLFVQVEICNYEGLSACKAENHVFEEGHYKKFITPYTAVIDLQKSEDEILENMKPKGRYNIKVAQRKWVECKIVKKNSDNIKAFYEIFKQTTSRDSFAGNSLEYYTKFLDNILWSELILAYKDGVVIIRVNICVW